MQRQTYWRRHAMRCGAQQRSARHCGRAASRLPHQTQAQACLVVMRLAAICFLGLPTTRACLGSSREQGQVGAATASSIGVFAGDTWHD
jgi:hypothetical protein